jgi:NADH-quinone oxidoreductase subunit H
VQTGACRRQTGRPTRAEGGFPVPPMDLKVPPSPRLRSREPVTAEGAVVSTGRRSSTAVVDERPDEENRDV